MPEYVVIDEPAAYRAALDSLRNGHGDIAVDVERASGFRYSQRAYLIQVYRPGSGVFLFDPPAIGDLSELQSVIGGEHWILHAASQDLPSLREVGLTPETLFDTELAARLLGWEKVGLGAVVEVTLGIVLKKEHSAADWSTRPLPESWLEYAALDVVYLNEVADHLRRELDAAGKTAYAEEEFAAVRDRPDRPTRQDPWRRLSGLHTLRGARSLAIARSLWNAREDYARAEDIAPGRLVPDRSLVAAIKADPATKHDLAAVKEFTGRASRSQLDRWWNAIEAGRADPNPPVARVAAEGPPPPRAWADRDPAAAARLTAAKAAVDARAEELSMPIENLLTPDSLRRVAWQPPGEITVATVSDALRTLGAREWQIDETAQRITDAFVESVQSEKDPSEPAS